MLLGVSLLRISLFGLLCLFSLVSLFSLGGCSTISAINDVIFNSPPKAELRNVQVIAESGANQNIATRLDLVFVYDLPSVSLLPKNGVDWFNQKTALMNGLAKSIDVVSLEVPPSMIIKSVKLPDRYKKALGVYSYADYIDAAGQSMGNLTPFETVTIRLAPHTVTYVGS